MPLEPAAEDKVVQGDQLPTQPNATLGGWKINRKLVPLKMFYFLFYGASGSSIPFLTIYLKFLRLNASETGLIIGLSMLVAMLMRSVIGMIADKMSAKKTALVICCLGFGAALFSLRFVPQRVSLSEASLNSTNKTSDNTLRQNTDEKVYWVCSADDGKEICRYPASMGDYSCQIARYRTLSSFPRFNLYSGVQTVSNQTYDTKGLLPVNEKLQEISDLEAVSQPRTSKVHIARSVPEEHNDIWQPCFYVGSETTIDYQILNKISTEHSEKQETYVPDSSKYKHRSPSNENLNPQPTQNKETDEETNIHCLSNCTSHILNSFYNEVSDRRMFNASGRYLQSQDETVIPDIVFLLTFLLLITGKSFYSAATSLVDAVTYTLLGSNRHLWGRQRLWGTIGTGIVVISVTAFNDSRQVKNFDGLFIVCLVLSSMAFFVGVIKLQVGKVPKNKTFFKDLKTLLSRGSERLFLCKLLFYGMMSGASLNFIFWFLADIGSSQVMLGVCLLLYCISSVVCLSCSSFVLQKLGAVNVMYLTLVAYAVRYLVLSFLTIAWTALSVEILQGVTYSLFWAAASSTASLVAPSGTQVTSQALAGAVYWDLGRGIGIVITGQFLQLFGARWTFRAYSIVCIGVMPLFWMLDRTWPLKKPAKENVASKREKDGEVGACLLQTTSVNGHMLNSDKDPAAEIENEKKKSVINRECEHQNVTEKFQEVSEDTMSVHNQNTNYDPESVQVC